MPSHSGALEPLPRRVTKTPQEPLFAVKKNPLLCCRKKCPYAAVPRILIPCRIRETLIACISLSKVCFEKSGLLLLWYECPWCNWFHLWSTYVYKLLWNLSVASQHFLVRVLPKYPRPVAKDGETGFPAGTDPFLVSRPPGLRRNKRLLGWAMPKASTAHNTSMTTQITGNNWSIMSLCSGYS